MVLLEQVTDQTAFSFKSRQILMRNAAAEREEGEVTARSDNDGDNGYPDDSDMEMSDEDDLQQETDGEPWQVQHARGG